MVGCFCGMRSCSSAMTFGRRNDDMDLQRATRDVIAAHQRDRFARLLAEILPRNRFYATKFGPTPANFDQLPLTTKAELIADQERQPPYGTVLTYPTEQYTRLHQTSGTHGAPMRWLDTPASWNWMLGCWAQKFDITGITAKDRLLFAFSFGPF